MNTNKTLSTVKPGGMVRLGDALPPLPPEVDAVRCMIRGEKDLAEACDYYYTAEQMQEYARAALSAQPHHEDDLSCAYLAGRYDARQPVVENPAWRDELVREAYNRGLADGLNADRQPVDAPHACGVHPNTVALAEATQLRCSAESVGAAVDLQRMVGALVAEDPVEQMHKVVEVARENDLLISRSWVSGWAEKWAEERAARHSVGEPVGFQIMRKAWNKNKFNGRWESPPQDFANNRQYFAGRPGDYRVRDIYAAQPAQAVDLGPVPLIARALAEWHEDDGNVLWWAWCGRDWAGEPAWAGTPNDSDWPGYHTHWTPHPSQPALLDSQAVGNG